MKIKSNKLFKITIAALTGISISFITCAIPVPSALEQSLQKAKSGDIVDIGFSSIDKNDILNNSTKLKDAGGQLIYSDDPETVKDFGILYSSILLPIQNRIYIYHVNGISDQNIKITALIVNEGINNVKISYQRKSLPAPSPGYITVGREGVKLFYENTNFPESISISPGEVVLLDKKLDNIEIPHEQLLGAIYDISASTLGLNLYILAMSNNTDTIKSFTDKYKDKYATNDGYHREGTFTTNSRISSEPYSYLTSSGIKVFEIASNKKFSQTDLPIEGIDNETGNSVVLKGNYGVTYSIDINCQNDNNSKELAILLNPRGGSYGGYFQITDSDGNIIEAGYSPNPKITVDKNNQASVIAKINLSEFNNFIINFIPAGSTNTPIDILLVPVKSIHLN